MTQLKLILALGLAVVLLAGGWWITALRADRARLGAELAQAKREAQGLKMEAAANVAALARRTAEQARLREETAAVKKELEELYARDEEARAWAGQCLPGLVFERVR